MEQCPTVPNRDIVESAAVAAASHLGLAAPQNEQQLGVDDHTEKAI